MSLRLHRTEGVNPRMTACGRCGKDVGVALIGALDKKFICGSCNTVSYGSRHCIPCDGHTPRYDSSPTMGEVQDIAALRKALHRKV